MKGRVVIDANLTLLLVVGETNKSYIASHKRLSAYAERDYDLLSKTIEEFDVVLFTPNVLTETSNLLRHAMEPRRSEIARTFQRIVVSFPETYVESSIVARNKNFVRLGLSDSVLIELASTTDTLLTADFDAYYAVLLNGGKTINFNHLRAAAFDY